MRFLNWKVVMIMILSIVIVVGIFIAFIFFSNETMEVKLDNIKVYPLKKFVDYEGALNNYGTFTDDEKKQILNNIDDYKEVIYTFEIKNQSSSMFYSVHHRVQPLFSEDTKKILVKSQNQLMFPQNLKPGESYKTMLRVIIKTDQHLSDQEILNIVSKDHFTITGEKVVWVIPFGDETITVGPFQKN